MDDENVMFQRLMTGILPGGAGLVAWFLAMIGDAKDYKDEDGK